MTTVVHSCASFSQTFQELRQYYPGLHSTDFVPHGSVRLAGVPDVYQVCHLL